MSAGGRDGETGIMEEMAEFYSSESWSGQTGLLKSIGVPELEWYFKTGKFESNNNENKKTIVKGGGWDIIRRSIYEEAVRKIKENSEVMEREAWAGEPWRCSGDSN
ncbi:unnamed protein product [Linum trigynum]|uniref:Uncharacterized protein n=1 Tax=Linum trigynum TaxID=586398 RepID=A0AAV2D6C9_9ROSI